MQSFSSMLRKFNIQGWDSGQGEVTLARKNFEELIKNIAAKNKFDEKWYLDTYPDVRQAVRDGLFASAHEHYIERGYFENRIPSRPNFNADAYLRRYADLQHLRGADDIEASAYDHFRRYGFREGRTLG